MSRPAREPKKRDPVKVIDPMESKPDKLASKPAPSNDAGEPAGEAAGAKGTGAVAPPKPRGRPKGSTNKRTVKVQLAPEVRDQLAIAPLYLAGQIVAQLSRDEQGNPIIELSFPPESLAMVKEAFGAWLESAGLELSPGWALIGAYLLAFGSAVPKAVQDVRAAEAKDVSAKPAPTPPGPAQAPQAPAPVATSPAPPVATSPAPSEPAKA